MSTTIPEEDFEDDYVLRLKQLMVGRGIVLKYERDRGAIDLGIRLNFPASKMVSPTQVWFQLKGLHSTTHSAEKFVEKGAYADVEIAHLREWYDAPAVVYVAIWVEAAEKFVAQDVRDLVEQRWGIDVRWDEVGEPGQVKIRVWIPADRVLDDGFIDGLQRHASMRIDAVTYRGQYLGHSLDPLRNELEVMPAETFRALVHNILKAHEFVLDADLDPGEVLTSADDPDPDALTQTTLVRGRLFGTLRWPFSMSIEYGYSDIEVPREEGQWFDAHGSVAVLTMSNPGNLKTREDLTPEKVATLLGPSVQVIVFINDVERNAGPWRFLRLPTVGSPLGLGALSTVVLLSPVLHRAHSGHLRWGRPVNGLWPPFG